MVRNLIFRPINKVGHLKKVKKQIKERLLSICFLINAFQSLAFIALFFGIIPLTMIFPNFAKNFFGLIQNKIFLGVYTSLTFCSVFNWLYCLRFWYKYDRYSKAIFPLIFPNLLYAPFYYYQVKIMKRPLINGIKKESVISRPIQLEEYENESDFERDVEDIRKNCHS